MSNFVVDFVYRLNDWKTFEIIKKSDIRNQTSDIKIIPSCFYREETEFCVPMLLSGALYPRPH